jgi:hypothetical protein
MTVRDLARDWANNNPGLVFEARVKSSTFFRRVRRVVLGRDDARVVLEIGGRGVGHPEEAIAEVRRVSQHQAPVVSRTDMNGDDVWAVWQNEPGTAIEASMVGRPDHFLEVLGLWRAPDGTTRYQLREYGGENAKAWTHATNVARVRVAKKPELLWTASGELVERERLMQAVMDPHKRVTIIAKSGFVGEAKSFKYNSAGLHYRLRREDSEKRWVHHLRIEHVEVHKR